MPKEYSPFTPGQPVPVDFFVGREEEINTINQVFKTGKKQQAGEYFYTGREGQVKVSLKNK